MESQNPHSLGTHSQSSGDAEAVTGSSDSRQMVVNILKHSYVALEVRKGKYIFQWGIQGIFTAINTSLVIKSDLRDSVTDLCQF